MPTDGSDDVFTANDADLIEQQQEVSDEAPGDERNEALGAAAREANEADVVEQTLAVSGDDDYPRGPVGDEPV